MISHLEITGLNLDLNDGIKKYAKSKIGRLDRFVPRSRRDLLKAEVKLRKTKDKTPAYECEVILHIPDGPIICKETTINMFAAVDIVEAKVKNQLLKYKSLHSKKGARDLMGRISNKFFRRNKG